MQDPNLFWKTLGKKSAPLGQKVFLGQEMHSYMVHVAYNIEMILKASKNYAFVVKIENSKYAPDENFCSHICPRRKAANFCHPGIHDIF